MAEQDVDTNEGVLRQQGSPPPIQAEVADTIDDASIALPRISRDDFDALLDTRASCRNYDSKAILPQESFSQLMARVFGARGIGRPAPGFEVIKRTSPSGGALHPTECWLIVQRAVSYTHLDVYKRQALYRAKRLGGDRVEWQE